MGRLERIWVKRAKRGPMDAVDRVELVAGAGVRDSANQGGKRQVTLVDVDRWREACAGLGEDVDPVERRANLLVSGVELMESRGKVLSVGGARILLRGETRPCDLMDEARPGLQRALRDRWAGGAYGEVLEGGEVSIGDPVVFESP